MRQLVAKAGFESNGDAIYDSLGGYCRFGSKDLRDKYVAGDTFDRLEIKEACEEHQALVRTKKLRLDGLGMRAVVRSDVGTKGLLVKAGLPMRAIVGEGVFAGSLSAVHACDCNTNSFAFLTKDNTLRPCDFQELNVVRRNDGIVYLSEGATTELMLFVSGSIESLKVIARNSADYSVSVEFEDLEIGQPFTWGFFRERDLMDADWNCQSLRIRQELGLDREIAPGYFVIKGGKDTPAIVRCRLTGLRVVGKDDKVVGAYAVSDE